MPEAATAARTWLKLGDFDQFGPRYGSYYELCDSIAGADRDWRASQIHKQHFNFTTIIRVNCAGRVDDRKALS